VSWQKCPICNGSGEGKDSYYGLKGSCPTCKGHRIIHSVTVKTPKDDVKIEIKPIEIPDRNSVERAVGSPLMEDPASPWHKDVCKGCFRCKPDVEGPVVPGVY
jgi:hypothetical protein